MQLGHLLGRFKVRETSLTLIKEWVLVIRIMEYSIQLKIDATISGY